MSFEIEGRLHKKYDTESKTATFQAREFVIEIDGNYPQFIKFQLVQDRCRLLDSHNEGEIIKVYFDLRGREWQGRYFTNLNAWKIEAPAPPVASTPPPPAAAAATTTTDGAFPSLNDAPAEVADDELPF